MPLNYKLFTKGLSNHGTYVQVSDLPQAIQAALSAVGYARKDISLEARESISPSVAGGQGSRGFFVTCNLATGARSAVSYGSWGGANMFNKDNQADMDHEAHVIPFNGAVIKGSSGNTVFATVYVNPDNLAKMLPAKTDVSADEARALGVMLGYKASYRKDEYERLGLSFEALKPGLIAKGLIKVNAAGSATITTEGKNAAKRTL